MCLRAIAVKIAGAQQTKALDRSASTPGNRAACRPIARSCEPSLSEGRLQLNVLMGVVEKNHSLWGRWRRVWASWFSVSTA